MEKSSSKKLWLMCGVPGIGKSTWIAKNRDFFEGTAKVVSRDKIRFALLDEGDDYFSREDDVWANYIREAKLSLSEFDNTILDATHISPASRKKILSALKNNLKNIEVNILVFDGNVDLAIKRNKNRKGRSFVPESIIRRMSFQMIPPSAEEGFENIFYIRE